MQRFDPSTCPLTGCVFIEASAGTGKTHSITSLVLRLVLENELEMNAFLLVTYTNAATDELQRKTRERFHLALRQLNDELPPDLAPDALISRLLEEGRIDASVASHRLRQALLTFDELAVLTIHGFCQRVLRERAFESGQMFDTELEPDETSLIQETVYDFWRLLLPKQDEHFFNYLRQTKRGLADLLQLARTGQAHTDAIIIPDTDASIVKPDLTAWMTLLDRAQRCLATSKEEIHSLLTQGTLNGKIYQAKRTRTWFENLGDWFHEPLPLPSQCDKVARFSNDILTAETKDGQETPTHAFFDLCQSLVEQGTALEDLLKQQWTQIKRDLLAFLREKLPQRKQALNRFGYEDLLHNALHAMREDSGSVSSSLASEYPVILIDEFQDTDPTQHAIFKSVHDSPGHRLLCLIGDPKQAIYGFRGGDIHTYTHARGQADYLATLTENWRSSPGLIQAVNIVYSLPHRPFWTQGIDYHEVESPPISLEERQRTLEGEDATLAPMQLWQIGGDSNDAAEQHSVAATCQEIARLIQLGRDGNLIVNGRPAAPSDIAILIRSHSQAIRLQKGLAELGIGTVSYNPQHIFSTLEADMFDIFLRVLAAPRDESLLKALLLSDFMGFSDHDLRHALTDDGRWGSLLETMASYRSQWRTESFIVMFRRFLREQCLPQRLLASDNGERRLTNVLHLSELAEEAQSAGKLSIHAMVQWFHNQRDSFLSPEHELRLESDDDRVKILTIHRSKGLEFPFVFMPFAWKSGPGKANTQDHVAFHRRETESFRRVIDVGSEDFSDHATVAAEEQAEEELRLLYVALTRAQHRLYLLFAPETKSYKQSSLAYLWHHRESDLEGSLAETGERISRHSMARTREELAKFVGESEQTISLTTWDSRQVATLPQVSENRPQDPRYFQAQPPQDWGITSYSSLVGHGETLELPDRDAPDPLPAPPVPIEQLSGMDALPRGAQTGNMLHAMYENLSFDASHSEIEAEAADQLERHGMPVDKWLDVLTNHTRDFFLCDLGGFRLADILDTERLNELAFHFPITQLTVSRLEGFFIDHGMLTRPHQFDFYPVEGFLKGFIDLVFQHDGRFYIADYKSNFLGGHAEDYHRDRLPNVMADSNYVLQYHLYIVALHRYLRYRIGPSYNYEKHFGGVRYLFVRGIHQESSPEYGVFTDHPEVSLIEDLSTFLTEPRNVTHG